MLRLWKNQSNGRVNNCFEALTTVREVLVIDTTAHNTVFDYSIDELNKAYIAQFNQGDTIYRWADPYASEVVDKKNGEKTLYHLTGETGMNKITKWPYNVGTGDFYLRDNTSDKLIDLREKYGANCRTRINELTIDQWVLFWAIADQIESFDSIVTHIDDRIPARHLFLNAYNPVNWDDDFVNSFSKEDAEREMKRKLSSRFKPIRNITSAIDRWVSIGSEALYSIAYRNHFLIVNKLSDVQVAGYYAVKENHPFAEVLKFHNLL